jgi:hypothetical protein
MSTVTTKSTVKTIKVSLKTSNSDRYKKALSILSSILPQHLTEKEMKIVALLYEMGPDRVLTTEKRRQIRETMEMSGHDMNNYVRQLKIKSVLYEAEPKVVRLNRLLDITLPPNEGFVLAFIVSVE